MNALPPNRRLSSPGGPPPSSRPSRSSAVPPRGKAERAPANPKRSVRTRSEDSSRHRLWATRWLQRLSLMTGIIVVISASVLVAWGLRRYLHSSPRFAVRTVHVDGNVRRTAHQIIQRAGIEVGKNVFAVDEGEAAALLKADPWIEKATVTVDLPNDVSIQVVEREARALATIEGKLYLVDARGELFKRFVAGDPYDLPVVTGIDPDVVARDRETVAMTVRRALELMSDLDQAKISARYPVQELHLEPDGSLTVILGSDGISLVFGTPPYRAKVAKAGRILEELRYSKVKSAVLFLDNEAHPERVVVRMK